VTRDESGTVVGDESVCVVCADRESGAGLPASPVLVMKEARSLNRKVEARQVTRRSTA
jgi:hypothetical protein